MAIDTIGIIGSGLMGTGIAQVAATIPQAQLLGTIAGIGPQRALVICAEVLPITRFRTPGHRRISRAIHLNA